MELDQPVHCFGANAVDRPGGGVGQERLTPLLEGPAESDDLVHRAGPQRGDDLFGDLIALSRVAEAVGSAQRLGAGPGRSPCRCGLVGADRVLEPCSLVVDELLCACRQQGPDP